MLNKSIVLALVSLFAAGCTQPIQDDFVLSSPAPSLVRDHASYQAPALSLQQQNVDPVEFVEPTGQLALSQALALSLMHNPELKAYSWDVRAAEAIRLQQGLWPNPELDVEVAEAGGTGERRGFKGAETTIVLSQLIEMGNKAPKREKLAAMDKQLAGWDFESKRLELFTDVTKTFIEVLAAQEKLSLNKELLKLSEEILNAVNKRVQAGKDSPLEETKAKITLSKVKMHYHKAAQELVLARNDLVSYWASTEPVFNLVSGKLDDITPIPSIEKLANQLVNNPEISKYQTEVNKARAALDLAKADSIPDLSISAGMQRFNETNDNAVVFGLSVPLPVSDRNQGGRLEAVYNLQKAIQLQKAAYTKVRNELNRSYRDVSNSYLNATELQNNVLSGAEQVFHASRTAYMEGKLDYLYVIDAQRTFFEAKSDYIDTLSSYHEARTNIEKLIGQNIDKIDLK